MIIPYLQECSWNRNLPSYARIISFIRSIRPGQLNRVIKEGNISKIKDKLDNYIKPHRIEMTFSGSEVRKMNANP